jgi:flagellar basal body rod protein FlgG
MENGGNGLKCRVASALLGNPPMNVSLFQAAAAMNANSRWQEVISENLASASIPGFKHQDVSFQSVAGQTGQAAGNGSVQANMAAPKVVTSHNFSPGVIRPGGPEDLAIEGAGFFEVTRPDGSTAYTRDGEFHFSPEGVLTTKQGFQVMGTAGAIQRDINNPGPFSISSNGDISQGADKKGQIKLVEFEDVSKLKFAGDGTFEAGADMAERPSTSTVRQGYLEGSNTSVVNQMAEMIQAMRSFEANQKVIRISDERMSRAITQLATA